MPGWIGVSIDGGSNLENIVSDNIFGIIPDYTAFTKGIYVGDGQRITMQNNIFKDCDLGIELQSNATNCQAIDNIYVNATTRISNAGTNNYHGYMANGELRIDHFAASLGAAVEVDRKGSDGDLIRFYQAGILEGAISVNGSTVTYGGGHLARWSQLPNGENPAHILKGTVMTNLEEMCEWGEELNEQLNKTMISFTEGDVNVAGVFVAPSPSDDIPLDFFVAMTGDMIIRIGKGVSVARGDLLMSAGDGTAKPQDDDIIRSKTIAKVTSAHVSCVYDDGSYCVPCVLMAC
jgi:parallel beta-helix repeat protein